MISPGTQVVALVEVRRADGTVAHPRGAAGVVVQAPADAWHSDRVRFPDGHEAALARRELAVLRQHIAGDLMTTQAADDPLAEYRLFDHRAHLLFGGVCTW